ncbi:MAG: MmcQ/YjbR family DNA-binding protein [Devosiaceae bacterium]|nr:MmcQ/YjbR family DNA-binding protein [Devosiaceae bacterium]
MSNSERLDYSKVNFFVRDEFEAFILKLPAATLVHQWGNASIGKVGGKIFAIFSIWNEADVWHVSFKCSDLSFEMLSNLEGITKAKYLARAKWVDVSPNSELSAQDIGAYIVEAHRLIASKLTKAKKNELGLNSELFKRI